ncbi:hypothetical protein IscW_ISCW011787 [Ixodes scapularis]|uniref:Uncharacterized protein n=1 Tax=Ixodes scapularis TaxID=6945 RepID=B7Q924_IXOSC|nr:hypothetical protein IscW_ISCW011787 [Ixodes scapularis]|eukprot:XP_002412452.1 hypothetical protein IscW_ISCW011787 [Ixodes scapularis]
MPHPYIDQGLATTSILQAQTFRSVPVCTILIALQFGMLGLGKDLNQFLLQMREEDNVTNVLPWEPSRTKGRVSATKAPKARIFQKIGQAGCRGRRSNDGRASTSAASAIPPSSANTTSRVTKGHTLEKGLSAAASATRHSYRGATCSITRGFTRVKSHSGARLARRHLHGTPT